MRYAPVAAFPLSGVAIVIFLVVLAVFIGVALILNHHWHKYEVERHRVAKLRFTFFGVGAILLFLLLIFLVPLL